MTVAFPGGGTCRVPSIDVLITIKRAHLYPVASLLFGTFGYHSFIQLINYAVKWDTHINSYHELLKLKASLPSTPSSSSTSTSPSSSDDNNNILSNIQQQITHEGKIVHADKTIAPQLLPFSTDYDMSGLTIDQKLQLMASLLKNYKASFATFRSALEWACTTGPPWIADVIISHYPELVKVGDVIWKAQDDEIKEKVRTLEPETNSSRSSVSNLLPTSLVNSHRWLKYLPSGSNKPSRVSFEKYTLPPELGILKTSLPYHWLKHLRVESNKPSPVSFGKYTLPSELSILNTSLPSILLSILSLF